MPDIEEGTFDYDSDQDSPNNQSAELQSSNRPEELEEWERSVVKSISFRHTFHEKLDHLKLKNWLQTTFKGGVVAPEKGSRNGKLHYQCYILHVDKKEFNSLFDKYKEQNSYSTWTTTDVEGKEVPFKGNKLQCIQDTRELHKLASYCVKDNKNLKEVLFWGIPPHILQLYASLSKLKHDTKEILEKQTLLDESFLLNKIDDFTYINEYIDIYHSYGKDFRMQKIKDHWITLKSKKDSVFKSLIINKLIDGI